MKNKFKAVLLVATSLLFFACDTPTSYKQELGLVDNVINTTSSKTSFDLPTSGTVAKTYSYTGKGADIYIYGLGYITIYGIKVGDTLWSLENYNSGTYTANKEFVSNGITVQGFFSEEKVCYLNEVQSSEGRYSPINVAGQEFPVNSDGYGRSIDMPDDGSKTDGCLYFHLDSSTELVIFVKKASYKDYRLVVEVEEDTLSHPVDKDAEGYYIPNKYWYSSELVTSNTRTGEIWSFDAKAGQQYAVYLYEKNNAFYVFEGSSKTTFESTYLKPCEQKYNYSYSENLYDRPALVTPEKDGKYYLKVTGSSSPTSEYSRTGQYDICVCKGRDGESFVSLTMESVDPNAWVEGELKFNKKDAWHDYVNGTVTDWVDWHTYRIDVTSEDNIVVFTEDKENGGTYTAGLGMLVYYWNGSEYNQNLFDKNYEYKDNDSITEGYSFVIPNDIALEDGESSKYLYLYFAPALQEGADSVTTNDENIGTFRIAVKKNGEFIDLTLYNYCVQYQVLMSNTKTVAVGSVLDPYTDFDLVKYDGTYVNLVSEKPKFNYYTDEMFTVGNYRYIFCKKAGQTAIRFIYPLDDGYYYFYCNFNILEESERDPNITINISEEDASLFCVGNYAPATVTYKGNDITSNSTTYWAWLNPNEDAPTITNCDENGQIPCMAEGSLLILVQEQAETNDIVYKEVTVKSASENPYQIMVASGNVSFGNSATFALTKNGVDVTSSATWTCSSTSVDFDADTKTATFYKAGEIAYINATYEGHTIFYYCNIEDSEVYNLTFDMPFAQLVFGSNYSKINLSGTYDETSFNALLTKIKTLTKSFTFDMSQVTGIETITASAGFADCSKITALVLPKTITSLANSAFANCTELVSVTLPSGITTLGFYVFKGCTSLTTVNIPSSLTKIGFGMFQNCTSLTTMEIPDTVTDLATSQMFSGCTSLTKVTLPNGVTSLSHTFNGCTSLVGVVLPSTVTEIGNWVFYNCTALKRVTIPSAIQTIGERAFYGCKNLETIYKDHYSTTEAQTFYNNYVNATTIGTYAFYGCESLSFITPQKVVTIGARAFQGTKIYAITIPTTTTYIGKYAFYNCSNLTRLFFDDITTWYTTTTDNVTSGGTKMSLSTNVTYATYFTSTNYYCSYNWYKL